MMSSEELNHNFEGEEEFLDENETIYIEDSVSNISSNLTSSSSSSTTTSTTLSSSYINNTQKSTVQATSVASEQAFSIAGQTISSQRNRLEPQTAKAILCFKIKSNK